MATITSFYFKDMSGNRLPVKKGDILEFTDGRKATFIEFRRVKWLGKMDGKQFVFKGYSVIKGIVGTDKTVFAVTVNPTQFKSGDLFSIEGKSNGVYMFSHYEKNKLIAYDLGKNNRIRIGEGFTYLPIDLSKIKNMLPLTK